MDLQSILDASDSSDEADYEIPSYKVSETSSHMDLEQILREDDEDDGDVVNYTAPGCDRSLTWDEANADLALESNEILSPHRMGRHDHEKTGDWAVLQAILGDDDDDDDDDNEEMGPNDWLNASANPSQREFHFSESGEGDGDIQAFLEYQNDNDDEDTSTVTMTLPTLSTLSSPARKQYAHHDGNDYFEKKNVTRADFKESMFSSSLPPSPHFPRIPYQPRSSQNRRNANADTLSLADQLTDALVTTRALAHAQAYERKLLKPGHGEIVSPLMVKRRLKPKLELSRRHGKRPTAPLTDRLTASSVAPRYNFSGVVENKIMANISASLVKHADMKAKVPCGLPTCLAFNSKFIAIGTQLGIILMYDLFEVLRQRLGAGGLDENFSAHQVAGSITSLDLNYNGEIILAGYTSGMLVLWDTIKGIVLRSVNDIHFSPITSLRFLQDLKAVTVDVGGLVNKLTFGRNNVMIWSNHYSLETDCLLDGTAGQILATHVLSPYWTVNPNLQPKSFAHVFKSLTLLALSSERSSFCVAVDPSVNVLHRWPKPSADQINPMHSNDEVPCDSATFLPCLSWGWSLVSGAGNEAMPMLARSWGCCLQFLCASFPTLDDDPVPPMSSTDTSTQHWPAFGVHDEIDSQCPIVALEWLNHRSLVYLTHTNEFTLVDTVMMTLLERLDFSNLRLVYAEFSLSRSVVKENETSNEGGGGGPSTCTTFQNSIRCSDDRLMVLCQDELKCVSIVGARRRISSLEEDGEWLEALALALDHYENTVVSQENRKRDQSGLKELARHPEFSSGFTKSEDEEWIAKLLIRYMNLAVDNAPEPASDLLNPYHVNSGEGQTRIDLAQSHFQMLAGVCIEFCVVTRRLDLLYGPIFRRFQSVAFTSVFMDVLEPYVLNDKLSYIAPEVMSLFVEHCKATNGVATVERCLLHMDCTIMDFDTILSLLRNNEMYTALCFVFNHGLDDYVTPLEILLERIFDEGDAGHILLLRRKDGLPQNDFERIGYKAILYLRSCFNGQSFPHEDIDLPEIKIQLVRSRFFNFLLEDSYKPSAHVKKAKERMFVLGQRAHPFPYLRILLQVDAKCVLDTLAIAIDTVDATRNGNVEASFNCDKQETIDILSSIILPGHGTTSGQSDALMRPQNVVNAFLEFVAKYIVQGMVRVNKALVALIIARLAERFASATEVANRKAAQGEVLDLLSAMPRDAYNPDDILGLIDRAGIHRAALLLHQQVASSWQETGAEDIALRCSHFQSAIDCYMEDDDVDFRKQVFDYIRKECSGAVNGYKHKDGQSPKTLRDAIYAKLPQLVHLDPLLTARLVAELLVDDLDMVIQSLSEKKESEAQFLFLEAIVSGYLARVDPVAGSVLKLTMEHHHKYLSLMAKLHPELVYEYLSTHDSYRAEDALKLCQEYEIADASAYLFERTGNVSSALQLILQTFEARMMGLKRSIRGMGIEFYRQNRYDRRRNSSARGDEAFREATLKKGSDIDGVKRILVVALDLCERNAGSSMRGEQGSQLWFNVLDRLINAKGFLRLSKEQPEHAKAMEHILSNLLRLAMQRMVSSVALPDLVRKVTSDHSGSRLGDLREMVESLLGTYGFEQSVFHSAMEVFHQDIRNMAISQRRLQVEGAPVSSIMNLALQAKALPDLRHMAHEQTQHQQQHGVLCIGTAGNACFVEGEHIPYSQLAESGLATALTRLRSRRGGEKVSIIAPQHHAKRATLNFMTTTELDYLDGDDTDAVVYDERVSGVLGAAEHHGRLMTFY